MVVVGAKASADRGFGRGCVNDRQPWSNIELLLWPIGRSIVGFAGGSEEEVRLVNLPLRCCNTALHIPSVSVNGRGDLLSLGLIGCLQYGVAESEGDG